MALNHLIFIFGLVIYVKKRELSLNLCLSLVCARARHESLGSIGSLESNIDYSPRGSERGIYDKVKGGLYKIRNTIHDYKATLKKEGIIAVASGAIGCGLAEATRGIEWDPDPGRTGGHTMNYGWPFPTSRLVESINQSGSYTNHFYFLQGLPLNATFYSVVAFVGLNAVVIGVPFGAHKLREWNTNRKTRNLSQKVNQKPSQLIECL